MVLPVVNLCSYLIEDLLPDLRIDLAVSGHLNLLARLIVDFMVDRFHQSTIDRGYAVQVSDHLGLLLLVYVYIIHMILPGVNLFHLHFSVFAPFRICGFDLF
jgi:hypothetical protein